MLGKKTPPLTHKPSFAYSKLILKELLINYGQTVRSYLIALARHDRLLGVGDYAASSRPTDRRRVRGRYALPELVNENETPP
jgi:hypothetical protein